MVLSKAECILQLVLDELKESAGIYGVIITGPLWPAWPEGALHSLPE